MLNFQKKNLQVFSKGKGVCFVVFLGGGEINSLFERRGMKETWKHVLFNGCLIYVLIYCTKAYLGFSVQANILDEMRTFLSHLSGYFLLIADTKNGIGNSSSQIPNEQWSCSPKSC